ncbi:hypothetical protein VTI74DRAFT_11623 [Chaetomium olivicolor]
MELNSVSIHDVIHPTAAFLERPARHYQTTRRSGDVDWDDSQLNPKNRIDSLDPPLKPLWRIDGGTGMGERYFAVPLFLADIPPMRFDVFIPEEVVTSCPPALREVLDLDAAFHTKDEARLRRLGIARHILRTLQLWTLEEGTEMYSNMCNNLPFGSRIIFENLHADIHQINILVAPTYDVERSLIKLSSLREDLGLSRAVHIPEELDISRLSLVKQLYDSVCVVRIRPDEGDDRPAKLWVFKAMTSDTKYLYVELHNLLRMPYNKYVMWKPRYIVTKVCKFGEKKAVVGFIMPFHAPGSLRDHLPLLRMQNRLTFVEKTRWAMALAVAVTHVKDAHGTFYPDLRLDNILLSPQREIVMVDFEQRGVWCEFAAPEVNAIEYMRILASDGLKDDSKGYTPIPESKRQHYASILDRLLPGWDVLQAAENYTDPRPHGYPNYNIAWLCLDAKEQESAMVYMLARVLWCIFEGQCAPQHAAVWQSYPREPDLEFPAFRDTPPAVRGVIEQCTRGRRDTLASRVVRYGNKLVVKGKEREGCTEQEVREAAREWWREEVEEAEKWIEMREEKKSRGEWDGNWYQRPSLMDLVAELWTRCHAIMKVDDLEQQLAAKAKEEKGVVVVEDGVATVVG